MPDQPRCRSYEGCSFEEGLRSWGCEANRRAAGSAGVSERTAYRWLDRYRAGDRVLHDRSSAPRNCRHRLAAMQVSRIEQLRRQRMTGPAIARSLGLARSTVGLVLRRLGLNRLAWLDPRPPVLRYERQRPGELIHIDIKTLGRIDGVGHRITGQHQGHHRARGIGYEHLHVAIDDASRLAYVELLPSLGRDDATGFLNRALAWYARLGARVERVMTDNGSAYRSKLFAQALQGAGARHIRTRPYTPRTNGKAERFIQTSLREWAYARPYASSNERLRNTSSTRRSRRRSTRWWPICG
ncbi:integrase [Aminobacter sp. Y103A]|uniref:IS481 family transposase n=1 Tax=Aminobacter sp. Y103A TaxID=1870862 RepID=UPI0025741375|nr:IS481 family transposase [Aminobacter sp. SS-2016]BBD38234.1 integrase [Aminobacter sp. SS-2016]